MDLLEDELPPPPQDGRQESPAMRRYRRLLRQRQQRRLIQDAEEASQKLRCISIVLLAACILGLFAPNSLPVEMLLGLASFPVIIGLLVIKLMAPSTPIEVDEEGVALVERQRRTKQEILDILIEIPVDTDMAGAECDICQEEYVQGDIMAASPNPDCSHMFHQHCIVEWLMDHDVCPICRRNYLGEGDKEAAAEEDTQNDTGVVDDEGPTANATEESDAQTGAEADDVEIGDESATRRDESTSRKDEVERTPEEIV